jgi:hypothetical protein
MDSGRWDEEIVSIMRKCILIGSRESRMNSRHDEFLNHLARNNQVDTRPRHAQW